jgi:hypothetical protein
MDWCSRRIVRRLAAWGDSPRERAKFASDSQRDLFLGGLVRALGYGSHAREQALDTVFVKEAMRSEVLTTTPDTLTEGDFVRAALT